MPEPAAPGDHWKNEQYNDIIPIPLSTSHALPNEPLAFFTTVFAALAALSIGLATPIAMAFAETGIVPRLPTAVLAVGIILLAFLSLACGFVLDTLTRGRTKMKQLHYLSLLAPGGRLPQ